MFSQDKKRQETCMSSLGSLRKDCRQGKKGDAHAQSSQGKKGDMHVQSRQGKKGPKTFMSSLDRVRNVRKHSCRV